MSHHKLTSITFSILILLLSTITVDGKVSNRSLRIAEEAFRNHNYVEALKQYQKAYKKVSRKDRVEGGRISYQMGLANMRTNNYSRAEAMFRRALVLKFTEPDVYKSFADVLLSNGKSDEARKNYEKLLELEPDNWHAKKGIGSIDFIKEWGKKNSEHQVEIFRPLNSRFDDYSTAWGDHLGNVVLFASNRVEALGKANDPWFDRKHTSIFVSYLDRRDNWSKPELLDEGPINTEFNEGAPSTSSPASELFFTRCVGDPERDYGCRIYMAERDGTRWRNVSEVVLTNDSLISVGHPAISPDGLSLFFVSNMRGGLGGMDIWVSRRRGPGDTFGPPVNLGPTVNTPADEMFPYQHQDGSLFFSSNGHPGFGNLDIFKTINNAGSWSKPENLGQPINSDDDDFGLISRPSGPNQGFFSSNRGSLRRYNIYSFYVPAVEFFLAGSVKDKSNNRIIQDVSVQLIGSDGSMASTKTNERGLFSFDKYHFRQEVEYDILFNKPMYFSESLKQNTIGFKKSHEFNLAIQLEPIPKVPIVLPDILYEFGRWELLPQYGDSLNGLIQTLNENPGLVIELASHTDSRGSDEVNDQLSQRRAQSVVDYLIQRGIHPDRLRAKGYGKRVPRKMARIVMRDGFTFQKDLTLTEAYINRLPSEANREAAHALNRRTEFRVLSDDFDPKKAKEVIEPARIRMQ